MNKLFLWIAAASAFVLQSCENTDGIRDEIGSLRDRVIALEAKIGSVNTSIVALHKLMDESTIIVGIEPNAKGYEIELSDGTRCPSSSVRRSRRWFPSWASTPRATGP